MSVPHAVTIARGHLGDPGPNDTCMSNGLERWSAEAGLATLGTASVSAGRARAQAGRNGWAYHEGIEGIRLGDYGDWREDVLGPTAADPHPAHVSIVETLTADGRWRGIGSGTPAGVVSYQPRSGGTNPLSVLRGYFRPPAPAAAPSTPPKAAPAPKPAPAAPAAPHPSSSTHVVVAGDTVSGLAEHFQVSEAQLLAANPPLRSGVSADFHIARASLIVIGQRIRIP